MSYTSDVKKELTTVEASKKCCQLAQIMGFLRFAGSVTLMSGGMGIKVTTDNPAVARLFVALMKEYFGTKTTLEVFDAMTFNKGKFYELSITPDMNAEAILREVGILGVKEGSNYLIDGIAQDIIKKRCCRKAALRGIFLAAGSVTDPVKSYHLEIVCNSSEKAEDVKKLINSFGLKSKISERRNRFVVYIKEAEQIGDFLNIIGATGQFFKFQDVRMTKETINTANRISNCENANLEKMVGAAQRQISDIKFIEKTRSLDYLNDKLRKTAILRLNNPDAGLSELAEMFDPPLKKAGLFHRLAKISEIAEKLRKDYAQ